MKTTIKLEHDDDIPDVIEKINQALEEHCLRIEDADEYGYNLNLVELRPPNCPIP